MAAQTSDRETDDRLRALAAIADETSDLVGTADPAGRALYVNPAGRRLLGVAEDAPLRGMPIADLHPAWAAELIGGEALPAAARDGSWRGETALLTRDGAEIPVSQVIVAHRGAGGEIAFYSTIARDLRPDRERETLSRTVVATMAEGLVVRDRSGRILVVNSRAEEIMGLPAAALEPGAQRDARWSAHDEHGRPLALDEWPALVALRTGEAQRNVLIRITRPDGSECWVSANSEPVHPPGGGPPEAAVNTFTDVTERVLADRERRWHLAQQEAVGELGALALAGATPAALMREAAQRLAGILGVETAAVLEPDLRDGVLRTVATADAAAFALPLGAGSAGTAMLEARGALAVDARDTRGAAAWEAAGLRYALAAPVRVGGEAAAVLAAFTRQPRTFDAMASSFLLTVANLLANALERARAEDQIRHQALHDALTGLPNRALVVERLEHALARAARTGERVALLFLDLDHFKHVNDSLGHGRGDELLVAVSERLRSAVRPPDTVGRLGGDDFVVLCENVTEEIGALVIAERLTTALRRPFRLGDEEVFVSASVGVALPGPGARTAADLLRDADAALYRAKGAGRGRHELFDASLRARAVERLRAETALRHAVERDELRLHYQPIVSLQTGAVEAVEALVRWQRPGHGMVPPGDFIPIAEASGLIVEVGAWVVDAACAQLAAWNAARPDAPLCVSLNLAARQVRDQDLPSVLTAALERSGVAPAQLQFEITETVLVEDTPETAARLRALLDLGVRLVLDDFGRGYSSLHYLTRFPIVGLKLDRAFIAALPQRSTAAITAGVVGIARELDLAVVAEGVETESQLAAVQELGCARAQGFLLSRPVEAERVDALRGEPPWRSLVGAGAGR